MISFGKSVCVSELHANIWPWFNQPATVPESQGLWWAVNRKYCYFPNDACASCAAESWCVNAAKPEWKVQLLGSCPCTPHTSVSSVVSRLCGSVEKHTVWAALTGSLQGFWACFVAQFVALDEQMKVYLNLCVCFPWLSFCSPYSIHLLALFGVPCGSSE